MKKFKLISILFYLTAAFDGILGLTFLFFPKLAFDIYNVTYPNHWGYIQFPAALLVIFGCMFLVIAKKPLENRNLIPYGIGLKFSYSILVFIYWALAGLPNMWKPFAFADTIVGILFIWSYVYLGKVKS